MRHPAGDHIGVGRRAVWYGVEVEGRPCLGHPTAFLDSWPMVEDIRDIKGRIEWHEISHLFLTENFTDFEKFAAEFIPDPWEHQHFEITIGTSPDRLGQLLALPWIDHARLIVRASMEAGWIGRLRTRDQVSVGEPYNLVTWVINDGVHSVPADYRKDKT